MRIQRGGSINGIKLSCATKRNEKVYFNFYFKSHLFFSSNIDSVCTACVLCGFCVEKEDLLKKSSLLVTKVFSTVLHKSFPICVCDFVPFPISSLKVVCINRKQGKKVKLVTRITI